MKNLLRTKSLSFMTIILTMMMVYSLANYSCSKTIEDQEDQFSKFDDQLDFKSTTQNAVSVGVQIIDNTLIFSSEESFQRAIDYLGNLGDDAFDNWEKEIGFMSLRRSEVYPQIKDKPDNLIATLLNPQAEIIVGSHKFKIDFEKASVVTELYLPGKELDESIAVSTRRVFSFHDDVFAILSGEDDSKGTYCGGRDQEFAFPFYGWPTDHIYNRVRYYTIGIYNTVSIHMDRVFYAHNYDPLINGFYTINGESSWKNSKDQGTFNGIAESTSGPVNLTNRPYQRTRRLTYLYLKVYFYTTCTWNQLYNYTGDRFICCHSPGCTQ